MYLKHLSASTANTYVNTCEFKTFLEKHVKLPELLQTNIYAHKGLAVHETLENLVKGTQLDYLEGLKTYYQKTKLWELDDRIKVDKFGVPKGFPHPVAKNCAGCPWSTLNGGATICSIAARNVESFDGCPRPNFEDDLKLVQKRAVDPTSPLLSKKILGAEVEFKEDIGGFNIFGYMDLVFEYDEDTMEVRDYKTGNWTKSSADAVKDFQMRIYSIAAKIKYPQYKYVRMTLDYLRKKPITITFDKDDDDVTIEYLRKLWKHIEANKNPKIQPNFLCGFCVGTDRCREIRASYMKGGKFIMPPPTIEKEDEKDTFELV